MNNRKKGKLIQGLSELGITLKKFSSGDKRRISKAGEVFRWYTVAHKEYQFEYKSLSHVSECYKFIAL